MQTDNLLYKALFAGLMLLGGCTLFRDNTALDAVKFNRNEGVWKFIPQKELKASLAQSADKKIILNVYPLKRSRDFNKQDFDLMVFFQDAANPGKNLGGKMDNNIFEAQSAWYIDLLRSKKVEKKDIPLGYYIEIDGNSIRDIAGINVCLWPKTKAVQYYFLTRTDSREIDTVPKCPPDCFESRIVGQGIAFTRYSDNDSVPKCPPACNQIIIRQEVAQSRYVQDGKFELLRERTMRTIIDNSYNKQTYALTKQD